MLQSFYICRYSVIVDCTAFKCPCLHIRGWCVLYIICYFAPRIRCGCSTSFILLSVQKLLCQTVKLLDAERDLLTWRWEASVTANEEQGSVMLLPGVNEEGGRPLVSQPIRVSFMFSAERQKPICPLPSSSSSIRNTCTQGTKSHKQNKVYLGCSWADAAVHFLMVPQSFKAKRAHGTKQGRLKEGESWWLNTERINNPPDFVTYN